MGILPPGFRFHPTDVELVMYYLKRKVMKKKFRFEAMAEINVYKYEPWDLADKSLLRRDLEWYFFSPRERKYGSGARTNRATEAGYWKATGKDRAVIYNNRAVGMIKTLIFYKGHAPKGERTDWVMHEYRIEDKNLSDIGIIQDSYVICKFFQKSGLGPKNGAQYGAPFSEEEWNEVESAEEEGPFLTEHLQASNHKTAVSLAGTTTSCSMTTSKVVQCPTQALVINQPCSAADPSDGVVSWLPICTDVAMHSIENYTTENTHLFKSPEGAQGPITRAAFSEEVSNAREICAIPSPVSGQVLSVHSPYGDLDNLSALNSNVPGTTSGWPVSELGLQGPSTPSILVTNMPYDLPEDDITELLSMLSEDSSMIPIENNEHFNMVHTDQSVKAQTCVDKNSIFSGLGDLNDLGELRKSGLDFLDTCVANYTPNAILLDDDMIFLELKDLDSPLKHPAEARESVRRPSDSPYSPNNCYHNMDGSFCVSNIPNSVQNVSRLNSTSFPPEGPCWMQDIVGVSRKGPGIQNLENYGSDTFMGNNIPFRISGRQSEGSSIASQIQRRGTLHRKFILQFSLESVYPLLSVAELYAHIIAAEKLNDSRSCGGSTINFKAEVALKVGECTEDALSHDMGESNCMYCCWGNLPKKKLEKNNRGLVFEIISYQWIVISLLGKIFVRSTYLINMIINWLILHPVSCCCVVLLTHVYLELDKTRKLRLNNRSDF